MVATHPTPDVLSEFLLGKLPDPDHATVEDHLTACPECQAAAAGVRPADGLVALLAAVGPRAADTPPASHTLTAAGGPPPAGDLAPPPELADHPRYRVLRPLGAGGMGAVWLCEHAAMRRSVAVKVIRSGWAARREAGERFDREVRAVAALAHPNVVSAFDAETVGAARLLVMEFVDGPSLADEVRAGPLPAAEACRAARDAARGLAAAHAAGLVHRDVKPANLIRAAGGAVKVLDFGLAVAGGADDRLTGPNVVMGTPDYIAPEQAEDPRAADARSDVYALGCTLYHLLAGRPPFPAGSVLKTLDAHRTAAPPPLAGMPPGLAAVVGKMMAKRPADRFPNAAAVAAALDPFCDGPLPPPRRRWWVAAAGGLAALAVAGGVWVVVKDGRGREVGKFELPPGWKVELTAPPAPDPPPTGDAAEARVLVGPASTVPAVAVSPDGATILTTSGNQGECDVILWDARTGREKVRLRGHRASSYAAAFSPNGGKVVAAAAYPDSAVRVWDAATGRETARLDHPPGPNNSVAVFGAVFSADGSKVYTAADDHSVREWDAATGRAIRRFDGHASTVRCLAISPDGRRLASGGTDDHPVILLWDTATGREVGRIDGHPVQVNAVAFSPDGAGLLSADLAGNVRLWGTRTGKEVRRFDGHVGRVDGVGFTPDGRRVVTGGADRTVRVWDAGTGQELARYTGHTNMVMGLAVSPDGRWAVSAGADNTARVWRLPPPGGEKN